MAENIQVAILYGLVGSIIALVSSWIVTSKTIHSEQRKLLHKETLAAYREVFSAHEKLEKHLTRYCEGSGSKRKMEKWEKKFSAAVFQAQLLAKKECYDILKKWQIDMNTRVNEVKNGEKEIYEGNEYLRDQFMSAARKEIEDGF